MKESAFHANDIRGLYPSEIDEALAYNVGFAFAKQSKAKKIIIGRDNRRSSKSLSRAAVKGIRVAGTNVIDIGLVDTPGLYYSTGKYSLPGIMITASHNPPKYNGIICSMPFAQTLGSSELKSLISLFDSPKTKKKGHYKKKNITKEYEKYVLSKINKKLLKPIKIVIDTGNGMSGLYVKDIFSKLHSKVIPLFWKLDGRYPHHYPNTALPENLRQLQDKVKEVNADLGIIFDGDADRAAFVDEKGNIVPASFTASLFSEYLLSKRKGKILYNVIASKIVKETIENSQGQAVVEKIGHTHMKKRMRKEDAIFGAEEYGHYYFKDNYYADSGLIAGLLMYEILSFKDKPLSEIISKYNKYFKSDDINIDTENKIEVAKRIENFYINKKPIKIEEFDGKTLIFNDFWINIRASNTESIVRLTLESNTKETQLRNEIQLKTFIKSLPL